MSAPAEALRHSPGVPFAADRIPGGEAVAVARAHPDAGDVLPLGELWPLLHACRPQTPLHAGVSRPVPAPGGLNSALNQARYALAAARAERPDGARVTAVETLEVFLSHHGSWARTAETLDLRVNTVHYRIQRIETLTGRDLSRLEHTLDLQAALLCC
ncbi:helix-turn-helix domain-containing protein [Streptomyces decoyicus]|uniref:helix-turn-helix domain-containing protein n=1 Tax=Streptomyces decoyicus TaxID=249567 RepID=UPI0033AEA27B